MDVELFVLDDRMFEEFQTEYTDRVYKTAVFPNLSVESKDNIVSSKYIYETLTLLTDNELITHSLNQLDYMDGSKTKYK